MNQNKKITFNAVSAIIQVAFTALLYFFLYKYLLTNLGIEQLGVWSLILSFSSIANLANFGITSGLVKFVAEYLAEKTEVKIGKLILTSIVSLSILFLVLSLLVLLGAQYFLHFVIDEKFLEIALVILPFSLGSLSLNALSGVFTSVLEGFQKNYLRNLIYIFSGIVMFVFTVLLVPAYGLKGVAIAQLIQAIFILLISLLLVLSISRFNRFNTWRWSNASFKELFNYGYKFQVVSVCQLLYEPTTKLLLSKFGGLALLGNYEMANRLVTQFRALLVNANQVVIPVVTEKVKTRTKAELQHFYKNMNRVMLIFTLPSSVLLFILAPFISHIWIGNLNYDFVFSMWVLLVATVFNVMCGPAYFSCMGQGKLSILVRVHIAMAILNLLLGYLFAQVWGGHGIIVAWAVALSFGSLYLIHAYNKKIELIYLKIFNSIDFKLLFVALLLFLLCISAFFFGFFVQNIYISSIVLLLVFIFLNIPILWKHDLTKNLLTLIKK